MGLMPLRPSEESNLGRTHTYFVSAYSWPVDLTRTINFGHSPRLPAVVGPVQHVNVLLSLSRGAHPCSGGAGVVCCLLSSSLFVFYDYDANINAILRPRKYFYAFNKFLFDF